MMDMIPSLWMGFRVGWVAKLSRWKAFPDNFTNKNKDISFNSTTGNDTLSHDGTGNDLKVVTPSVPYR